MAELYTIGIGISVYANSGEEAFRKVEKIAKIIAEKTGYEIDTSRMCF